MNTPCKFQPLYAARHIQTRRMNKKRESSIAAEASSGTQ